MRLCFDAASLADREQYLPPEAIEDEEKSDDVRLLIS